MYRVNDYIFLIRMLQLLTSLGLLTGGAGALVLALEQSVQASGAEVHPTPLPWNHKGYFESFDHARCVSKKLLKSSTSRRIRFTKWCFVSFANSASVAATKYTKMFALHAIRCATWNTFIWLMSRTLKSKPRLKLRKRRYSSIWHEVNWFFMPWNAFLSMKI